MKIRLICHTCYKEYEVYEQRKDTSKYCSIVCANEGRRGDLNTICTTCGKKFHLKNYRINRTPRTRGFYCSKDCQNLDLKSKMRGELNHQFGLLGDKNASFAGNEIISNYGYILEYCPNHPRPHDKSNPHRVKQHRLVIERNHHLFDASLFENINGWIVLKQEYDVHHIDEDKKNNLISNLQVLTRSEHSKLHNKRRKIGVSKRDELLENLEADNQQPSLSSNTFEGSTTNSQVQTDNAEDGNTDTSVLQQ